MTQNVKKVPASTRLPENLRTEFEIEAKRRRIRSMEAAYEEAIHLWLRTSTTTGESGTLPAQDSGEIPAHAGGLPARTGTQDTHRVDILTDVAITEAEQELLLQTLQVLRAQDEFSEALRSNIRAFFRAAAKAPTPATGQEIQQPDPAAIIDRIRELSRRADELTASTARLQKEFSGVQKTIDRFAPREEKPRRLGRKTHKNAS